MTKLCAAVAAFTLLAACAGNGDEGIVLTSTHGPLALTLQVASTVVGEAQNVRLVVKRSGRPAPGTAQIAWTMETMPMGGRAQPLTEISPGTYEQRTFAFSMSGTWHARVSFRERGRSATVATFTVEARE